ncbi:hypothetical protein EC973_005338 [Apophysomyces ossiformis]|uniref:Uncharacterized protein n=1 Tax=Apophysomyces ossiformis TaxID=679940 RepID=A0A8H7EUT4_9FUNG|nr:hypothetical protein EC973_005338 [Apophysomyces ossiformis]
MQESKKRKSREEVDLNDNWPTPMKLDCEDTSEHMKPNNVPDEIITCVGTGYDVVTMSATVSTPPPRFYFRITLYNRYQTLINHDEETPAELDEAGQQWLKFPKRFKIATRELDWTDRSVVVRRSTEE